VCFRGVNGPWFGICFARTRFELWCVKSDLVSRLKNNLSVFCVVSFFPSIVRGNLVFQCELVRLSKSCGGSDLVFCCVDLFVCA
jgi:hypothetical protein